LKNTKPDLTGHTIEIKNKKYLVLAVVRTIPPCYMAECDDEIVFIGKKEKNESFSPIV